jgi:rhodanese-related sulfurtransferase
MTALISRDELREALASGTVTLVDALPAAYYDQQHLPGAVNLVESDVAAKAGALLPDTSATIVTYCSNAACGNSQAVANRLGQLGYTDVRKYREGIQDWVEAGLPVEASDPATSAA